MDIASEILNDPIFVLDLSMKFVALSKKYLQATQIGMNW